MAEIDTRPLESVQAAVSIFDRGTDQSRLSPDRNDEEIVTLTKELASCKLQLEARESQHKQDTLKVDALQKSVQELADRYEKDCMDAHLRIAQLEAENARIMSRQSEADGECRALRGELDAAKASVAFVLREVEAMETRAILERESTKDALSRILQLNETVLSSAVAAIKAEEERSVFFQEATLQFLGSERDYSSEAVRRQMEMVETMEAELLAKTVEVEYLRSELKQVKETYVSVSPAQEASDATAVTAAGCSNSTDLDDQVQVQAHACEKPLDGHEAEAEFTFQHAPEECFVSEIFRKGCQAVPSDDGDRVETDSTSEDLVEDKQGAVAMVQDNKVAEGNSDAQETTGCLVAKTSGEDHHAIQPHGKNDEADNDQEPAESDGALPDLTACHGNDDDLPLQDHEETKADASFVLESSRDDFQSVRSDAKDISIAEAGTVAIAGNQEQPRAEADAAPTPTLGEGDSDTGGVVATEIVSKDEDEFYTKELEPEPGQGKKMDGYVLVSKSSADAADKDKQLDAARTEISDLRFSLEEAVRRAELAEEAKAALERELREEIRRKHTPSRRRAASDSEDGCRPAREAGAPPAAPTPARPRSTTPSHTPGTSSRALRSARKGGDDMPTPGCLTLGKVLSMKYK